MPLTNQIALRYLHTPASFISRQVHDDAEAFLLSEFNELTSLVHVRFVDEQIGSVVLFPVMKVPTGFNNPAWCSKSLNLIFRAVHDYHHSLVKSEFTLDGEIMAYHKGIERYRLYCQRKGLKFNIDVQRLLYSEIVFQAATFFYLGDFPDTQKVVL